MDRETYIQEGLIRHIEEFDKHYPNLKLFVIALQGSQNYDLDIYSDEYKFDLDTALDYARYFDTDTNNIKNYYLQEKDEINKNALKLLNDIQYKIIKRRFIKDIIKEVE